MKVVVTGATGFVGKRLVDELLSQKDDVTIIARDVEKIPEKWKRDLHIVEASLEQISGLKRTDFLDGKADIFFIWHGMEPQGWKERMINCSYGTSSMPVMQ